MTCGLLHNTSLNDVLKVEPLVQGGQVSSHHVGANKPDPLAPKFGFSGAWDSDFRVPNIRIFGCLGFGFSETAGQGVLVGKKAGSTDNGTPRALKLCLTLTSS